MRKQSLPLQRLMSRRDADRRSPRDLRYQDIDALYAAVGEGHVSAQHVVGRLVASLGGEEGASEDLAEATVPNAGQAPPRPATRASSWSARPTCGSSWPSCCTPVPGDPIIGFVTRGNGVSVHRARLHQRRVADLANGPAHRRRVGALVSSVFLVQLQVEALDRNRLLSDVTRVLSDQHVNILSASVQTSRDRVAISRFTFEMGDPTHLDHVMQAVRKIDGVFDVYRITGSQHGAPRQGLVLDRPCSDRSITHDHHGRNPENRVAQTCQTVT